MIRGASWSVRRRTGPGGAGFAGLALAVAVAGACRSSDDSSASSSGGAAPPTGECPACMTDKDCAPFGLCGQFDGDAYCAPDCSQGQACAAGKTCTQVTSAGGKQVSLCVPNANTCGVSTGPGGTGGGVGVGAGGGGTGGNGGSVTGVSGGTLDTLNFAIVGDTRPANPDDTAGYPKAIIQKIWQEVEAHSPRPAFAVTTGDYMFASVFGSEATAQLDIYLAARAAFSNVVFPALGNHECTGATASNCGVGNKDGITSNYTTFMTRMVTPLGVAKPYYTVNVGSTTKAWTAKLVFVAANAWDAGQASWLDAELAKPTTYTFVVRHEGANATTAPGVTPSKAIMDKHPYTLLLAGHTHAFEYFESERQVIVGNGGAPLTGPVNYGYVVVRQRADGAIVLKVYDYMTNAVVQAFAVKADGTSTP